MLKTEFPSLFEMYSPYESASALNREEFRAGDADYWLNYLQLGGTYLDSYLAAQEGAKYDRYGNRLDYTSSSNDDSSESEDEDLNEEEDELPLEHSSTIKKCCLFLCLFFIVHYAMHRLMARAGILKAEPDTCSNRNRVFIY